MTGLPYSKQMGKPSISSCGADRPTLILVPFLVTFHTHNRTAIMSSDSENKTDWEQRLVKPILDRFGERKKEFCTDSGIPVDRIATPSPLDYDAKLGYPGSYPFTRGVYPTMYRG